MGLFRPYERTEKSERQRTSTVPEKAAQPATTPADEVADTVEGGRKVVTRAAKKGATPTRKEAEAARMQRLHPNLSPKDQRKADRRAKFESQQQMWDKVERSPERQLLRDYVDARWTVAEFMMPAMILIMALMMVTMNSTTWSAYVAFGLWGIFILAIINIAVMWRSYKRLLAERHPGTPTKGLLMYMINRAMMIRRFRRPGPRISRGEAF